MQVFFRFFASKKTSQKAWISTYCPYLCRHDRGSEHPCRQYSRIRKQAVPVIFDATYTDHFPAGQAGKIAVHTHAVREPIPNTLGRLELMKQNFNYKKDKSYEKATLHSRNPSFQPVQFCRVRRPDRQHPVRLQRRKKAEERSFRIHDQ